MKRWVVSTGLVALGLVLSACSQSNAPSEQLAKEAEKIVDVATGDESAPATEQGRWAPREECGQLEGAEQFLAMVRATVAARDPEAFAALAADDVKLDFGGGSGRAQLIARLAASDELSWEALDRLMTLGCAANSQGGLTLPWYFAQDIPIDPYAGMIVTGTAVPMHSEPTDDAPVLAELDWDVVELTPDGDVESVDDWRHVRMPGDDAGEAKTGWIKAEFLRSIIDYRLIAASRNGRWRITTLIAGD